jgi:septal ring factor EnvC (AmiA/AmiB activator)
MHRIHVTLAPLLLALPAHAGLFDDDLARQRIEQLRSDVNALTQRTETINKNQIDFANQLESIRTDLAKLRGQQEVMSYDLDAAQKRQKDFYIDLDNRLRKLESPPAEASTPAPASAK